jgi:hypothetical protein
MNRRVVMLVTAIVFAGCDDLRSILDPGNATDPVTIDIRAGQTRWLPADGLLITFAGVPQDSRCPKNAMCVWEGDGAVALSIRQGVMAAACTLHTTLTPKSIVIYDHSFTLKRLAPEPVLEVRIDPSSYIATLVID